MVVLAAKLRELAQIRNAGNNLSLKAVVLQATYAWRAAMLSARPERAPDGTQPRGCRNAVVAGLQHARHVWGGWVSRPSFQTREDRRTGN